MGWLGEFLVHTETPSHADVIVVLAGDPSGHRILRAAELVKQGYASKVLVSGPAVGFTICMNAIWLSHLWSGAAIPPHGSFRLRTTPTPPRKKAKRFCPCCKTCAHAPCSW